MHKRTNAFTLIELLVVIAIIAILAAILFPVFAQARESALKSSNLSQVKQVGTSVNMYTADYDDTMLLLTPSNRGTVPAASGVATSNGTGSPTDSGYITLIDPYVKNLEIYRNASGRVEVDLYTAPAGSKFRGLKANLTMNGYLTFMSMTQIESPSVVPLVWQGNGIANYNTGGYIHISPVPSIRGTHPGTTPTSPMVSFTRSGPNCTISNIGGSLWWGQWHRSYFVHNEGFVYARVDSSAGYTKAIGPANRSPFTKLDYPTGLIPGLIYPNGASAGTNDKVAEYVNQDQVDGPTGCTYAVWFSPYRTQ